MTHFSIVLLVDHSPDVVWEEQDLLLFYVNNWTALPVQVSQNLPEGSDIHQLKKEHTFLAAADPSHEPSLALIEKVRY